MIIEVHSFDERLPDPEVDGSILVLEHDEANWREAWYRAGQWAWSDEPGIEGYPESPYLIDLDELAGERSLWYAAPGWVECHEELEMDREIAAQESRNREALAAAGVTP
jgi:hypothetical protein